MVVEIECESKQFVYYWPYKEEKLQNAPLNHNQIGFRFERRRNPLYERLKWLNYDNNATWEKRTIVELKRILAGLNLPLRISSSVLKRYRVYHSQIEKGTKFRAERLLMPITIYLHCLEHEIILHKQELLSILNIGERSFNRCLQAVLRNNLELFKKLRTDAFRKKLVLKMLSSLKNIPGNLLTAANAYLEFSFDYLKNKPNKVIAVIVFCIVKELHEREMAGIYVSHVCRSIGTTPSVANNNNKLITLLIKKMKEV